MSCPVWILGSDTLEEKKFSEPSLQPLFTVSLLEQIIPFPGMGPLYLLIWQRLLSFFWKDAPRPNALFLMSVKTTRSSLLSVGKANNIPLLSYLRGAPTLQPCCNLICRTLNCLSLSLDKLVQDTDDIMLIGASKK